MTRYQMSDGTPIAEFRIKYELGFNLCVAPIHEHGAPIWTTGMEDRREGDVEVGDQKVGSTTGGVRG